MVAGHVRHFKGIDFYSERNRVYGGSEQNIMLYRVTLAAILRTL